MGGALRVRVGGGGIQRIVDLQTGIRRVREAAHPILLQAAAQQPANGDGGVSRELTPVRVCADDSRDRFRHVGAAEHPPAGEHLVQYAPERPDVGALVDDLAARLLRAHVRGRAEDDAGRRHRGARYRRRRGDGFGGGWRGQRIHRFREAEVEDLHGAITANLDVRGLEVAMDDALPVRGFQGFRDLPGSWQGLVERNRAPRETLGQVFALDQFHDERFGGVALFHPMDMGDVRMIQRGERLRFACEPREAVGIVGEGVREDLEGHVAIEPRIARAVHFAHPAGTQRGEDLVRAEASTWSHGQGRCVGLYGLALRDYAEPMLDSMLSQHRSHVRFLSVIA